MNEQSKSNKLRSPVGTTVLMTKRKNVGVRDMKEKWLRKTTDERVARFVLELVPPFDLVRTRGVGRVDVFLPSLLLGSVRGFVGGRKSFPPSNQPAMVDAGSVLTEPMCERRRRGERRRRQCVMSDLRRQHRGRVTALSGDDNVNDGL
ncbi:hypothetical protein LR48_Vigan09g183500 [Vigna angularis]|uniref:Uncharacterized protein n=1 Tax=Phaseolus angularis TaxID=3914 RepID=A0A0L9VDN8_PHAAN|nr:hypothetical protein LR48_Vigan09g183500 [Vigna angularis]